jgi:hypothetical protein
VLPMDRPAIRLSNAFSMRLDPRDVPRIDAWRARLGMSRGNAVRALTNIGLEVVEAEQAAISQAAVQKSLL